MARIWKRREKETMREGEDPDPYLNSAHIARQERHYILYDTIGLKQTATELICKTLRQKNTNKLTS
jgi:hypothetical protein